MSIKPNAPQTKEQVPLKSNEMKINVISFPPIEKKAPMAVGKTYMHIHPGITPKVKATSKLNMDEGD